MHDRPKNRFQPLLTDDALNVVYGMLMGGADVIPGVSGGTVALIVGIYERLVAAISQFDRILLGHLCRFQLRQAAVHIDLRFLVELGVGIVLGIVVLGGTINQLLTEEATRPYTLAAFFGAILASTIVVGRLIRLTAPGQAVFCFLCGLAGVGFAYGLTRISGTAVDPSYSYVFFCGMVAICAMILPGISGAFILLILGVYVHLTDYLHILRDGVITSEAIVTVAVFGTGCALGLVSFSKLLRWLLVHHRSVTMAVLCGFMLGALNKIWPFQQNLDPTIEKVKHRKYENVWPIDWNTNEVFGCIAVGVLALVAVLALHTITRKRGTIAESR